MGEGCHSGWGIHAIEESWTGLWGHANVNYLPRPVAKFGPGEEATAEESIVVPDRSGDELALVLQVSWAHNILLIIPSSSLASLSRTPGVSGYPFLGIGVDTRQRRAVIRLPRVDWGGV